MSVLFIFTIIFDISPVLESGCHFGIAHLNTFGEMTPMDATQRH